jgi:DNA-binding transcriptional ArsR family regulator
MAMATGREPVEPYHPTSAQLDAGAATFDMLSTPIRLHLMWLLAHGDHDVGWLAEQVGATVAAVSQHLGKLRLAGLVSARRHGRQQIYSADDPHILVLVEQVFAHIAPDGSLAPDEGSQPRRVRRRPRFEAGTTSR